MGGPFGSNIKMFLVGIWLIEPVCSNQANASPLFEGGALILAAVLIHVCHGYSVGIVTR